MILKFWMKRKYCSQSCRKASSKSTIHGQRLHQQAEITAMISEKFMGIVGTHREQK
jgi:hypothetical protein